MFVPNRDFAEVALPKVASYLLSATHPEGGGKAKFFTSHGFSLERPQELIDALLDVVRTSEIALSSQSKHGVKYVVDGAIRTPDGRHPTIRTVWIIEPATLNPRLVSAYPAARTRKP